ncbi:MAG: hypothetical protein J1E06_02880 [Acutalibacter sp.]|nr:hypothetical protein [Acutalibacter sp.]
MIPFADISRLFARNLYNKSCIEIDFCVAGFPDYQNCWMGKMPDHLDKSKEVYWFGLVPDGSQAYDFDNYSDFANAPVFDGKSLKQVWDRVELFSIDGCDPERRIKDLVY